VASKLTKLTYRTNRQSRQCGVTSDRDLADLDLKGDRQMTAFADIYRNRPARGSALADQLRAAEMHAAETLVAESMYRGDPDAFARFTTYDAVAPVLTGAVWLLAVVVQWLVRAGLTATADQVWAELADGITRWESES
jgi:hypothetical protein